MVNGVLENEVASGRKLNDQGRDCLIKVLLNGKVRLKGGIVLPKVGKVLYFVYIVGLHSYLFLLCRMVDLENQTVCHVLSDAMQEKLYSVSI